MKGCSFFKPTLKWQNEQHPRSLPSLALQPHRSEEAQGLDTYPLPKQAFLAGSEPGPDLTRGYPWSCRSVTAPRVTVRDPPETQGGSRPWEEGPTEPPHPGLTSPCIPPSPVVPVHRSPGQSLRPHEPTRACGRDHQLLFEEQYPEAAVAWAWGFAPLPPLTPQTPCSQSPQPGQVRWGQASRVLDTSRG